MLIKVYTDFITRQEKSQEKICRSLKIIYVRGNVIIADFSRCNSALQEYNIKRIANFTHSLIECVKIKLNEGINENHTECCDAIVSAVSEIREQRRTIVFPEPKYGRYIVPERPSASQNIAESILAGGGAAIMTGTAEPGSVSERLINSGRMIFLRYPVHQNFAEFTELMKRNRFARVIPFHSPELQIDSATIEL